MADDRTVALELSEAERIRVEAFGLDRPEPNYHTVTVATKANNDQYAEDGDRVVDRVTFVCTAPPDADCRTYPDCGCEAWRWDETGLHDQNGHERTPGHPCWLTDWFANEGATYIGQDADELWRDDCVPAIDRTGHIALTFQDEWVEWEFTDWEFPQPARVDNANH